MQQVVLLVQVWLGDLSWRRTQAVALSTLRELWEESQCILLDLRDSVQHWLGMD